MKKIFQRGGRGTPSFFIRYFTFLVNDVIFVLENEFNSFFCFSVKYINFVHLYSNHFFDQCSCCYAGFFLCFSLTILVKAVILNHVVH